MPGHNYSQITIGGDARVHLGDQYSAVESLLTRIPYTNGAIFDSSSQIHRECHPDTRTELLSQIQDWARQPDAKRIFWLNGMAGTGKSTISLTIAKWLHDRRNTGGPSLGASFFFKRSEGEQGTTKRFFPTIVRQLVSNLPGLRPLVSEAIDVDPFIFDKALGEQFKKLLHHPLQGLVSRQSLPLVLVVVVDALDECEKEDDIESIIKLWSQLSHLTTINLRLFLTSRPDLPVRLGFRNISLHEYQDIILQDAVPKLTIQHDLFVYLRDSFKTIVEAHNSCFPSGTLLKEGWPGDEALSRLVNMAEPLFLVAATVQRFVGDLNWDPQERLNEMLKYQGVGEMSQMDQTYLPVLQQMSAQISNSRDKNKVHEEFRTIVGTIVVLAEPLSTVSLATLLHMSVDIVLRRLNPLHSVLRVPKDNETPIQTLHASFGEFLVSENLRKEPFRVDESSTHYNVGRNALRLLSGDQGLRENICGLESPGQPQVGIDPDRIAFALYPALTYACRYWVYHLQRSKVLIRDGDEVHMFLQKHFLHWLEALSLIGKLTDAIPLVGTLRSLTSATDSDHLASFLEDAYRFTLANRYIASVAPLQLYWSAALFAPQESSVKRVCVQALGRTRQHPIMPMSWGDQLQSLEGHTDWITAIAFSPDGSLLASGSSDKSVRIWDPQTGQELQKLESYAGHITTVAFSADSSLLASASRGGQVLLCNPKTGQEIMKLTSQSSPLTTVNALAFSPVASLLAVASQDAALRLWNPQSGKELKNFIKIRASVHTVTFSPDGSLLAAGTGDGTIHVWHLATSEQVQIWQAHKHRINAVSFSPNGSLLASASNDCSIRIHGVITGRKSHQLEGHCDLVTSVVFSPDSLLLVSASSDKTIRIWDLATHQEIKRLHGHSGRVTSVAFSPSTSLLASASYDQTVRLWQPTTHAEVFLEDRDDAVRSMSYSPNGAILASSSNSSVVTLWNAMEGTQRKRIDVKERGITQIAVSNHGSLVALALYDNTIRIWSVDTGKNITKLDGHELAIITITFSPDSSLLATGSYDKTVNLWDVVSGQRKLTFTLHTSPIYALAFSADGSFLASTSGDQTIRIWDTTTGSSVHRLENVPTVTSINFAADGKTLFTDIGTILIENWLPDYFEYALDTRDTIKVRKNWVLQDNRPTLWLPASYRGMTECYRDRMAVGTASGLVHFFQFHTHTENYPQESKDKAKALYAASKTGAENVVRSLLDQKFETEWNNIIEGESGDIDYENRYVPLALIVAALNGHSTIVQFLIASGLDVNQTNESGWTALIAASFKGHRDIVVLLLDCGANLEAADDSGWTALFTAVSNGHLSVVQLLVERGSNIHLQIPHGVHALHIASSAGRDDIVRFLHTNGADISAMDEDECTALHYAASNNQVKVIQYLISKGADVRVATKDGQTAADLASTKGYHDVVHFLADQQRVSPFSQNCPHCLDMIDLD